MSLRNSPEDAQGNRQIGTDDLAQMQHLREHEWLILWLERKEKRMSVTSDLAEFVSRMSYADLPQDVKETAKKLILDLLGSIIYSSKLDWSKKVVTLVQGFASQGESTVIPIGFKTASHAAALANGTMAHGFELDDDHGRSMTHPGSVIIPAALAVGEQESVDGRKFILAVVMGYETMCRIAMAVGAKYHFEKGFHPTGTSGPFGAAAAAGKIIGLSKERLIDALGIAGSMCSGVIEFHRETSEAGDMIKRLHAGRASESGLIAALLSRDGFRGPLDIIGGKYGFCNVYSDHPQIHLANYELGLSYEILNVAIKPYACCGDLLPIVDGIANLRDKYGLKENEIEEIDVGGSAKLVDHNGIYTIHSALAAQLSVPFCVALTIAGNITDPNNFSKQSANKENIRKIMKMTRLFKDNDLDRNYPIVPGAKILVKLKGGKSLETQVKYPKGHPRNEMSFEEVCNKFNVLTRDIINDKRKGQIIELVKTLETVSNISQLTRLLVND